MKALIFAAGFGTRLRPVTETLPKALVPVAGKPMIEWVIERLKRAGVDQILINLHYRADQLEEYIVNRKYFGIKISFSDEREKILETGGGLKKGEWFFRDGNPFFVHNADVISNINLKTLFDYHCKSSNLVTLAVKKRPATRNLVIDDEGLLVGWKDNRNGTEKWVHKRIPEAEPLAFSGIQVVNPEVFPLISETGAFSMIPLYLRLAATQRIGTLRHDPDQWFDLGSLQNIRQAEVVLMRDPGLFL